MMFRQRSKFSARQRLKSPLVITSSSQVSVATTSAERGLPSIRSHFAEELAGAEQGQNHLASLFIAVEHLGAAADQDVERVGAVAGANDRRLARDPTMKGNLGDLFELRIGYAGKNRDAVQQSQAGASPGLLDLSVHGPIFRQVK
jgi:hypothetical protein